MIRKILEITDEQIYSHHWTALGAEGEETLKRYAFLALAKEEDKSLLSKITECVIQIASNAYNSAESEKYAAVWPDLLTFIGTAFTLEFNPTNLPRIENAIRLLEGIYGFIYESFSEISKYQSLLEQIVVFMKSKNTSLASRAVKALSEISFYASKKELKLFKDVVLPILEVTLLCFNEGKENDLKTCCKAIIEMSSESTGFLFKNFFPDLFILMGKIAEKKDYDDDNIRELAFEVIVNLVESKSSLFSKDIDRLKVFIESLIKYAVGMDKDITEDWASPSQLSYFDMESIYEKEVSCSVSFIERLIDSLSSEKLLPILSEYISKLLENTNDWRYKYVGIMLFKLIVTHLDDMVTVDTIFPIIFEHVNHDNPKIRFAALSTVEELADQFKPYFCDKYASQQINNVLNRFTDPVHKVQLEATEALNTIITSSSQDILKPYLEAILDKTFSIFLLENLPNNLRECLLNVVATLASEVQDALSPYANKVFHLICDFFNKSYINKTNKPLYGNLIECITLIGPYDKDTYYKIIPDLVKFILDIQESIHLSTDPIRAYIQDSLQRLVYILKVDFKELLPSIITSVMKLVQTIPEMSISSNPDDKFKLEDLLSSANSDSNEIKIKLDTNIKTSSTEEMASAIETLNKIIESLGELYLPFIEITNKEVIFYISYLMNEDIRQLASDTLPIILSIVKKHSNKESLIHYSKLYTTEMMKAIEREVDNETLCYFLENLKEIIEISDGFLIKEEVNSFFKTLLVVFDDVEVRRIKLLEKKGSLENEIINKKKKGKKPVTDDDEESDNEEEKLEKEISEDIEAIEGIQSELTDLIGKLFATHKSYSEDVINVILKNMIPKYFRSDASTFEVKMGIYLVDDIVEFLGQDSMPNELWQQMAKALVTFASHEECSLRQASLYGLGMFAKETKLGFEVYANDCFTAIFNGLGISLDNKDERDWELARDNGIAALGKIIKYQAAHVDLKNICTQWLSYLPIRKDEAEMIEQHELLCDIILNKAEIIFGDNLSNAPIIIKVLARVYNSKYSDSSINLKIKQIVEKIKIDATLQNLFANMIERESDEKSKKRLLKLRDD